jgi:hypothetical protein
MRNIVGVVVGYSSGLQRRRVVLVLVLMIRMMTSKLVERLAVRGARIGIVKQPLIFLADEALMVFVRR